MGLWHLYYRWIDRELSRPVLCPDATEDRAAWNQWVGHTGERLAVKYLRCSGKKVLYRNFRPPKGGGEVDIVYRDQDTLVFAEVKTRSQGEFGGPASAVDKAKQRLIIRGANAWLKELNLPEVVFRFDVIEVLLLPGEPPRIRVSDHAFTTTQRGLGM